MYVTYQAPVVRNGKTIGFAGTANTLAGVDATISKTKLLKTGYAFAVSGKGVLLSSPDKKNNGKLSLAKLAEQKDNPEFKQVAESVAAGKDGQLETKDPLTGKHIVLTWSKIDSAGWSFLTAVPVAEVLAPVNEPAELAVRHRPDHAAARHARDRVRRQPADQADPHRHRRRRAPRRRRRRRRRRRALQGRGRPPGRARSSRPSSTCARRPRPPRRSPTAT